MNSGELTSNSEVFAVSDGLHCSPFAARASREVLSALHRIWANAPAMHPGRKITGVHHAISGLCGTESKLFGMAATLVACEVRADELMIYHCGDSQAWIIDSSKQTRLTTDHTMAEFYAAQGHLTQDDHLEAAGALLSLDSYFVADPEADRPRNSLLKLNWNRSQTLILVSDGLSGLAPHSFSRPSGESLEKYCGRLVASAQAAGSDDNLTVIAISRVS